MNNYYVISCKGKNDDFVDEKFYLAYDEDEGVYFWTVASIYSKVVKREAIEELESLVATIGEFNTIENLITHLELPVLLRNLQVGTLSIEHVVEFEKIKDIDITAKLVEFEAKEQILREKLNEIKNI